MEDMAQFMNRQHIEEGRKIDTSVRTSVDFFGPFQRLSRFFSYHANEALPKICRLTCDDEVPRSEMRHPVHLGPRSTGPVCDREHQYRGWRFKFQGFAEKSMCLDDPLCNTTRAAFKSRAGQYR